jgi:hypothetical protein
MTLNVQPGFLWNETVWNPSMITTALWLDAADASTVTTVSGAVSQWNDKSGNARHLTQASALTRPAYSVQGLNNRNVISFDGSDDFLANNAIGLPVGTSARSVFAVYQPLRTIAINNICGQGPANPISGQAFWLQFRAPLGDPYFAGFAADVGGGPDTITTTPKIAEIVYNGTTGTLYGTGNQYNTTTVALSTEGNQFYAGCDSRVLSFCNALIGEILFIGSAVNDSTRQKIEGYLAHKWGLEANLPNDHPYKTVGPTP